MTLIDALEDSNSLLVAMLHEERPHEEISEQIINNRKVIDDAEVSYEIRVHDEWQAESSDFGEAMRYADQYSEEDEPAEIIEVIRRKVK